MKFIGAFLLKMSTNIATIDINKFDKICRTCLQTADLSINIFRYLLKDKLIANVLETCASIQVRKATLETNVSKNPLFR